VSTRDALWAALREVRDPELDEPVTDLGFVSECDVDGRGQATIRLRLPTYFCAPNFAYLMAADVYDAAWRVPGVTAVDITLIDHFAADEINAGVNARDGVAATFPGQTMADALDDLRVTFLRKAVMASHERVCRRLLTGGMALDELARTRLGDVPASPELRRLVDRRRELGLPHTPDAPLLVDPDGAPVTPDQLPLYLRRAQSTRVSIDINASLCRGLLETRYGTPAQRGTASGVDLPAAVPAS